MHVEPTKEHHWLQRLVGEWTQEVEAIMGPDKPPMKMKGEESVRSLGGVWTIGEARGEMGISIMTLGFDTEKKKFVGSFVGSMMTHQWLYEGSLDSAERVLTLDCEGPNFTQDAIVPYQDIIEFVDNDHRLLKSQLRGEDGSWYQFMTAHYYRKK